MRIYALISKGYSDVVGFQDGKIVHWSKTDFAKDEKIIHELLLTGKAVKISHQASPSLIRSFGNLLVEAHVHFQTYQLELSEEEVNKINQAKIDTLQHV